MVLSTMRQRIRQSFQWLGGGALLLAMSLFGRVSADTAVTDDRWQLGLLGLSALGVLAIIVGLVLFLINIQKLRNGGN